MDWAAKDSDFFDLCEQYLELVEVRARIVAQDGGPADSLADDLLADQIDDIDVRQKILMCRILFSGEQPQAQGPDEQAEEFADVEPILASDNVVVDIPEGEPLSTSGRESGGTARGRFALRGLAGLLKVPFVKNNSRLG